MPVPVMRIEYRTLDPWPHGLGGREASFERNLHGTLTLLDYEVWRLDGDAILIGLGLGAADITKSGVPRVGATGSHPGVEVSFDTAKGRLVVPCGTFTHWTDNLRAIAKGLEALRSLDRWGIATAGQQYTGWMALGVGDLGAELVNRHGSIRHALKATHPDHGGDPGDFKAVMGYKTRLGL